MPRSALSRFFEVNRRISRSLNGLLPSRLSIDGNSHFLRVVLPRALSAGQTVFDLGGGSQPFVTPDVKRRLGLTVAGLDIDHRELAAAPRGSYDRTIVADLCGFQGDGDADVVICQSALEHVPSAAAAMRAIGSILKPGGTAYIFCPCRNALYAKLNLILPDRVKHHLLSAALPAAALDHQGFRAFYDECTPSRLERLAAANDLIVAERHLFWVSTYFMNFVPAFLFWRIWQAGAYLLTRRDAAETFILVLRKQQPRAGALA